MNIQKIEKLIAAVIVAAAKCLTGAQARWQGCRPERRQRIFVANHTSHLDFVLLWAALPPAVRDRTRPVAAADYWQRGPVRRYLAARVFRAVLVQRGSGPPPSPASDPMLAALREGHSLILFPEGTRGAGEDLQPFKAGVFHIAKAQPDVQLVPVWMDNPHRAMPKGSLFPVPLICTATFGNPMGIESDEPKEIFLTRLQQAVREARVL